MIGLESVILKTPAKLNLALDIIGRDERGYHLMQMVMQSIDLFDRVEMTTNKGGKISVSCNLPEVPCDASNICYRCAEAFFDVAGISERGLSIHIEKQIPMQAGMAGGSSNGAGVLIGLNYLFQTGLSLETLCQIGAKIGADIPFCLTGGTARVEGFGERVEKIADLPDCAIVVAKPRRGVRTQQAFADFDQANLTPALHLEQMVQAIESGELDAICQHFYNALEQVCRLPDLQIIRNCMKNFGAKGAMMTGSGSAVFGVFSDRSRAYDCEQKLKARYPESYLCGPFAKGPVIQN